MTQPAITPASDNLTTPNIVVVPDLAAVDLTALAERSSLDPISRQEREITYIDPDYKTWNYWLNVDGKLVRGRGLEFETLIVPMKEIAPSADSITYDYARDYFRERGYLLDGNAGAFIEWRRTCGLSGYHVAMLEDNACWRSSGGHLYIPYSSFDEGYRELGQVRIVNSWYSRWSFVGFRAVY